ncbi:MAG: hypothetical protein WBB00_23220, partial [Mycobacterium sp.]
MPRIRRTAPRAPLAVLAMLTVGALTVGCTSTAESPEPSPSSAPLAMAAGPVPNMAPPPAAPV